MHLEPETARVHAPAPVTKSYLSQRHDEAALARQSAAAPRGRQVTIPTVT
jgi:hypothetical protein